MTDTGITYTLTKSTNTLIEDTMASGSPVFTDEPMRTLIILLDDDVWAQMGSPTTITVTVT